MTIWGWQVPLAFGWHCIRGNYSKILGVCLNGKGVPTMYAESSKSERDVFIGVFPTGGADDIPGKPGSKYLGTLMPIPGLILHYFIAGELDG